MTASVTPIGPKQITNATQPEIATVVSVDQQGRIERISLLVQGSEQAIVNQAKQITPAAIGETVLAQYSAQGWLVLAQLAEPSDSPSAHITDSNGHVKITGAKSVSLLTAKGTIEVHQDGKIILDATELSACSERDLEITGWPIRLN